MVKGLPRRAGLRHIARMPRPSRLRLPALLALAAPAVALAAAPAGDAARGAQLAQDWGEYGGYACAGCHGEGLRGSDVAPALAGRTAAYVSERLNAYRAGTATGANAAQMQAVATTMQDQDIADLSTYVAGLPGK